MESTTNNDSLFYGQDGTESCDRFVSQVTTNAFRNGKTSDSAWIANLAATSLRGEAMRWWMDLDDDVQMDWRKLRKAMAERYPYKSDARDISVSAIPTPAAAPPHAAAAPERLKLAVNSNPSSLRTSSRSRSPPPSGRESIAPSAAWSVIPESPFDPSSSDFRATSRPVKTNPSNEMAGTSIDYRPAPLTAALPAAGRITITSWNPIVPPAFLPRTRKSWLTEARGRRIAYRRGEATVASVHWLLVRKDDQMPPEAIPIGLDYNGALLFSARGWIGNGLHLGKCGPQLGEGASLVHQGEEVGGIYPFEVLVGLPSAVRWVSNPWTYPVQTLGNHSLQISMRPFEAIEGGIDANGICHLLTQAYEPGRGWQVGNVAVGSAMGEIGWYFKSYLVKEFRILVWAD